MKHEVKVKTAVLKNMAPKAVMIAAATVSFTYFFYFFGKWIYSF